MITSECIDKRSLGRLYFLTVQESELLHIVLNPCNKLEGVTNRGKLFQVNI